jgi:hypothetical protein
MYSKLQTEIQQENLAMVGSHLRITVFWGKQPIEYTIQIGKQLQTVLGVCLIIFQHNVFNKQNYGRKKDGAETLQNNLYITPFVNYRQ